MALLIFGVTPAVAAETSPDVVPPTIPTVVINKPAAVAAQEKVDMAKVKKALAASSGLNAAEKRRLVSQIRKQLPKKSDAEKASDRAETIARWKAMPAAEKAEDRAKATKRWNALSIAEKEYQRDKLVEKLLALPATDRDAVLNRLPSKTDPKKE